MRNLALAAALAALLGAQAAAAQGMPCFNEANLRHLSDFMLGDVVPSIARQCATKYPAAAPVMAKNADVIATRFAPLSNAAFPKLLDMFFGSTPEMKAASAEAMKNPAALKALFTASVLAGIGSDLKENDCASGDHLVRALLPLSDAQISDLLAAFIRIGAASDKNGDASGFRICRPGETR